MESTSPTNLSNPRLQGHVYRNNTPVGARTEKRDDRRLDVIRDRLLGHVTESVRLNEKARMIALRLFGPAPEIVIEGQTADNAAPPTVVESIEGLLDTMTRGLASIEAHLDRIDSI